MITSAQISSARLATLLNQKATNSKMFMSLGSTIAQSNLEDDLFIPYSPVPPQMDFDNPIVPVIVVETKVAVLATDPKNILPDFLSKIWHIKNEAASKVLDQSTQLCCYGADNLLSQQYSSNHRILR